MQILHQNSPDGCRQLSMVVAGCRTPQKNHPMKTTLLLLPVLLLAGCLSTPKPAAKKYYTFDSIPQKTGVPLDAFGPDHPHPTAIRFITFRAEPESTGTVLSARLPGHRRRFFNNHEFIAPPATLITARFRQAYDAPSNLPVTFDEISAYLHTHSPTNPPAADTGNEPCECPVILDAGAANANATHLVDGIINEIGGDLSDPARPAAILHITLRAINAKDRTVLWQRVFDLSTPIPSPEPADIIAGLNTLLHDLLLFCNTAQP